MTIVSETVLGQGGGYMLIAVWVSKEHSLKDTSDANIAVVENGRWIAGNKVYDLLSHNVTSNYTYNAK